MKSRKVDNAQLQYAEWKFGDITKSFTIGNRRKEKIRQSPGPGDYDHSRSDLFSKASSLHSLPKSIAHVSKAFSPAKNS